MCIAVTINCAYGSDWLNKSPERKKSGIVVLYDLKDTAKAVEAWEKLITLNKNAKTNDGQLLTDVVQSIRR